MRFKFAAEFQFTRHFDGGVYQQISVDEAMDYALRGGVLGPEAE